MVDKLPIKIDKIDKKIMRCLEENSRQSFTAIGKKVGLSSDTVEYRVNKLLRFGVILRLFAEPNLAKLGLKTFRIYIKVSNISREQEEKLVADLSSRPNTQWFAACDGEWDYILRFSLPSEEEFTHEMGMIMNKYGKFIRKKSIALPLFHTYLQLTYFLGGERMPRPNLERRSEKTKLDKLDLRILYYLYENARVSTIELAAKLSVSPQVIQYRIKKLQEAKVIHYYTAWYNRSLFGYDCYKVLFWFQNISVEREKTLLAYCQAHPQVSYINRVIGSWDLELDIDAANISELHAIVSEIETKFSDVIGSHSNLSILKDFIPNPLKQLM